MDELASLRDMNFRLFRENGDLKNQRLKDLRDLQEWEDLNRCLVDEVGSLRAVAEKINVDALAEQFAREECPGEGSLERICRVQSEAFAREFELIASEDGDGFEMASMNALEVVGTHHVHSGVVARVRSALRDRGWDVEVSGGGVGRERTIVAVLNRLRKN